MSSQTLTRQGTRSDLKWQEKVSKRRTERQLPIGHGEYTVLYPPGLAKMALGLAENLGDNLPVLCTDDIFSGGSIDETGLAWERFPSGDPNIKLRVDLIRDRHVVLLMNHDTIFLFEQLAVILFLQRFNVPHAKEQYARGKWKQTMADGAPSETLPRHSSAAGLTPPIWPPSYAPGSTALAPPPPIARWHGARMPRRRYASATVTRQ